MKGNKNDFVIFFCVLFIYPNIFSLTIQPETHPLHLELEETVKILKLNGVSMGTLGVWVIKYINFWKKTKTKKNKKN